MLKIKKTSFEHATRTSLDTGNKYGLESGAMDLEWEGVKTVYREL